MRRKSKHRSGGQNAARADKAGEQLNTVPPQTVLVVDDDPSALGALARLLRSSGYRVQTFDRPSGLRPSEIPERNACLLVDIYLPEKSGIEMCEDLAKAGYSLPAILMSGRNDAATRSLVDCANALAVLFKPIDEKPLLEAIACGIALSNKA